MLCRREELMSVLNALYDSGETRITVDHPADEIDTLLTIDMEADGEATVRFNTGRFTFEDSRDEVTRVHGDKAENELPQPEHLSWAYVASGLLSVRNQGEIEEYLSQFAYPDLEAGHQPVVLGLDTNIMAWRLPKVLDIDHQTGDRIDGRAATNGYCLTSGVKKELDWHYKRYDASIIAESFDEAFARIEGQPAGENRQGFLGLYEYRRVRDTRAVDIIESDVGDPDIIQAYREYDQANRKRPLLLSNDYGYIERAHDADLLAVHVDFPMDFPRTVTATWSEVCWTLYYLSILFGAIRLPKMTLFGVWDGKHGSHWQESQIEVECRSPVVEPQIERDLALLENLGD